MFEPDSPVGEFKTVTRARKPPPTEKAGKVTDARIISIETAQTTLLKRFDTIDATLEAKTKSTNAKLDLLLNRLPPTRAKKLSSTENAGKVTDARIIAIKTTQTTILKHFDTIDTEPKTTNAKLDILLSRLPPTLDDDLEAMTVDNHTVTNDLKTETESRDNLIMNDIDSIRYDMQTNNEATEVLIEAKH
eukprot:scaffold18349_cov50-Attheya_sp.AAC.1